MKQTALQILDSQGVVQKFEILKANAELPYRMKRHQEIFSQGDYWSMLFVSSADTMRTMSKALDFDERVIRHTVIKVGEKLSDITGYTLPENLV
ncbi:hypothetical protein HKX48_005258 [Thoreauomyces humboldtii]|nr:hypothetical protein HKX48_005258 [Thoreauomyces humboldtii]